MFIQREIWIEEFRFPFQKIFDDFELFLIFLFTTKVEIKVIKFLLNEKLKKCEIIFNPMNLEFVENDGQNGRHDNNRNEYNWNNRSQKGSLVDVGCVDIYTCCCW